MSSSSEIEYEGRFSKYTPKNRKRISIVNSNGIDVEDVFGFGKRSTT